MTFLSPTIAVIVGAAAFAGLILLYVLRLLRRPLRVSSVRFWPTARDETQVNVPWRAFRFSWLFLLHLLTLACAVFALARPAMIADIPAGDRVVILLDCSASMQCVDPGERRTRIERAQERAEEIADEILSDRSRAVSVLYVASETRVATAFTKSTSVVKAAIQGARVSAQPADIVGALELSGLLLGDAEQSSGSILVISDGSFRDEQGTALSAPAPLRFERIGYAATAPPNIGITEFSVARDVHNPKLVRVFAVVTLNESAPSIAPYTLAVNGEAVDSGTIRSSDSPIVRTVPLSLEISTDRTSVISLTVASEDALQTDNTVHSVLDAPAAPRIALITKEGAKTRSARDTFLSDVVQELAHARIEHLTPAEFAGISVDMRTRFDIVIANLDSPLSLPPIASLSFGAFEAPGVSRKENDASGAIGATIWRREDPVFDGITIDSLAADRRYSFTVTNPAVADSIAQSAAGSLVVRVNDDGVTRIALPFTLERSNFPLLPEFPIFVANCVDSLTNRATKSRGVSWSTDEFPVVNATKAGTIALVGDAPFTRSVSDAGPVTLSRVPNANLYTTEGVSEQFVAINLVNPNESELQSPAAIEFNGVTATLSDPGKSVRELTPYALGVLLALLTLEWFVFGLRSRI